jgi:hypothetical protein
VLGSGIVDPGWPTNGRAVSNAALIESRPLAVTDGAGGAIVNWQGFTVHLNMYAQHLTAAGIVDPTWPAGGRPLTHANRAQSHAAIVSDGAGGALLAWQDTLHVMAQHVLASGALDAGYPDTGRVLVDLPSPQGGPAVAATGASGAIVSWTDTRGVAPNIFAIQVLAAGTVDVPPAMRPQLTFDRPSPNPARGPLTLRYALQSGGEVRLAVFDITGRRVRELVARTEPAGAYAVRWDARDERGQAVSAGMYFARLEVEGRMLSQKLTTLR